MAIQTTYTHARANLAALCDEVTASREVVIIHRRGAEDVALIAAEELSGLLETAHLLRSPLRSTWCPVYASPVAFGFPPPSQMQHSVRVVGETLPGRDFHPTRNAKLRLAH